MRKKTIGYAFIIAAALGWSSIGLFNRNLEAAGLSLQNITAFRFGGSAVIFTIVCLIFSRQVFQIKLKHLPLLLGICIISMLLLGIVYFRAQQLCSIAVACILMYLAPSFVVLFSVIFWKTPLTRRKLLALIATLLGCALSSGIVGSDIRISPMGLLMGVLSGLFYAGYTIFSHYTLQHYSTLTMTYWTFLIAGIGSLCMADWKNLVPMLTVPHTLFLSIGLMVVGTILPFFFYTKGLETIESGKAAVVANLEPVFAAVWGAVFLHEAQSIWSIVGIGAVLGGVTLLATEKPENF